MRDPDIFANQFVAAIRHGTSDTESSSLAMCAFGVIKPLVMRDWSTWVVRNLGEAAITPQLLISTCLGPSGKPTHQNWLCETAWGRQVVQHCPHTAKGEAESAALLAMVLLKLTYEDWQQIADHMNTAPAIEPAAEGTAP